jgi:hypothetical protein
VLEARYRRPTSLSYYFAAPPPAARLLSAGDFHGVDVQHALRDLDQFSRRYSALDADFDQILRGARMRLLIVMGTLEPVNADTIRRNLRPRPVK